jgi:nicotinamide mononucleotide transporter PnuC
MSWKAFLRKNCVTLLLMLFTGIGITVTGIVFDQAAIRMLPLYVSLVIGLMHTRAIRYAHLLGSINVILYGFVNLYYGLVASAMSCFFFSCPMQMITFLRWDKNKYGSSTKFRKLSWRWRAIIAVGFVIVWIGVSFALEALGSAYRFLDNTATLHGILVTALVMLSFIEHAPLRVLDGILNIVLMLFVVFDHPEQIPYVIYNCYSLICVTIGAFSTLRLYKEQHNVAQDAAPKGELV